MLGTGFEEEVEMLRLLLGLIGVTSVIVAAALLFGGGSLLWADTTLTDGEGFINTVPMDVDVDGYALVAGPAQFELEPEFPIALGDVATIRLRVENQSPSQGIFVGIAETTTLDAYLGGAAHAIVEELESESMSLSYRTGGAGDLPALPAEQDFWISSIGGVGEQTLEWDMATGSYSFVVMNEDASEGMSFDAVVGARVPMIRPIGVGLLIGGGVSLLIGTILLAVVL
jgi:hypothetical protein